MNILRWTFGMLLAAATPVLAVSSADDPLEPQSKKSAWPTADDSPTAEIRAVPAARAQAAVARRQYLQAQKQLDLAVTAAQRRFEASDEYTAAVAAEQQAYEDYEQARQHALRVLSNDSDYLASGQLRQEMTNEIALLRQNPKVDPHRLAALARVKLNYATLERDRERVALANDPAVEAARRRLADASAKVSRLRSQFDRQVADDAGLAELRAAIDKARVNHLGAAAYLDGALEARDYALDYAAFKIRNDPRRNYGAGVCFDYPYNGWRYDWWRR